MSVLAFRRMDDEPVERARDGLAAWRSGLRALQGTAYGQTLSREVESIEQAIADADSGNLG